MDTFFHAARPGTTATIGDKTFELPILYFRDDLFLLFYTADYNKVKALMPSDKLHPIRLPKGRSLIGVGAFNYIDTSIGPYGEVGMIVPTVHAAFSPPMLLPALMEARYPGFGMLVLHLPVTTIEARDGGRGLWGYTKFTADMDFKITPEFMECCLSEKQVSEKQESEKDDHILTMRVAKKGITLRDKKPMITYSVKDGNLIRTIIPQKSTFRLALAPEDSYLELGNHPAAQTIAGLDPAKKPLLSRYYIERSAILPEGAVIEEGVRPLDGYLGKDSDGRHEVSYLE